MVKAGGAIELTRGGRLEVLAPDREPAPWMEPRWAMAQAGCLECGRHPLAAFRAGRPAGTSRGDDLRTCALVEAAHASADAARPVVPEAA